MGMMPRISENIKSVQTRIAKASKDSEFPLLIAVSKTRSEDDIRLAAAHGVLNFGENYLQEACIKIEALADLNLIWHFIGSIQSNKTSDIANHFDWVHTVDRIKVARRLSKQRPDSMQDINLLIQINIDNEDSKSGCLPAQLPELITAIKGYERLQLRGLMIIPAKANTNAFARTKQLFEEVKADCPELDSWDTLSMGMSGDMAEAIENGTTMVRVGTAIFGQRA